MSLRNAQKPLRGLLADKETASIIVAVPFGAQPSSVITATYDTGLRAPVVSNKAGNVGALSPLDGTSQQPVDDSADTISVSHLLKVGECANCSSDLYADNATADTMREHAHYSGSCVMCGYQVSYANSGELAQIATSVERDEDTLETEVANYFDFGDLLTVDPNSVEENDMSSNLQARRAIRASVADVISSINGDQVTIEQASDDEDEDDAVDTAPEEEEGDEDFADQTDDSETLEVMDMDESDPSEDEEDSDEDSDDNEEEASASADQLIPAVVDPVVDTATNVVDQPAEVAAEEGDPVLVKTETTEVITETEVADVPVDAATTEAPVVIEAPAEVVETPVAEIAEDTSAGVETPVADPVIEAPVAEVANDTVIEYQAATTADLSPDADLVPVNETAYYVVQNDAPVAILRKEQASEGAQSLWHKPNELRNAYRASLSGDRAVALASMGGTILKHSTNVQAVVAERITAQETAAAGEIATERAAYVGRIRQCLEMASLGITKGMFGPKFTNPVASELAAVLGANGVREPQTIIRASMIQSMPSLIDLVIEKAMELAGETEDALNAKAEMVGNAEFDSALTVVTAPAVVAVTETAATVVVETAATKRSYDISKLVGGLGKQAHVR